MEFSDKLSKNLRESLKAAHHKAKEQHATKVDVPYFLYGLFSQKNSVASDLLRQYTITAADIEKIFVPVANDSKKKKQATTVILAPAVKEIISRAFILALKHKHIFVGTEHCIAVLLDNPPTLLNQFFTLYSIDKAKLLTQVKALLRGNSKFPELTRQFNEGSNFDDLDLPFTGEDPKQNSIDQFATNITEETYQKNINPVVQRDREMDRLIQILCRKDKNNPVILGEPGVGKTALVEGLAKKIVKKEVPNILRNKKILSLDLSLVVAGTMYRGDFENRLKAILDEVKTNPNIILFIDELHNIVGTGSASGAMDAANILKPLLARGDLRCIGATTLEEYKKFIEKDGALERRFQPVVLSEPTTDETIEILHGIKKNYQDYHTVRYADEAILAAATLSQRYIQDKLLPDKAIDLLDEAAAKKRIVASDNTFYQEIAQLEEQLKKTINQKDRAVRNEEFNVALKLKQQEKAFTDKIKFLEEEYRRIAKENPDIVTRTDIIEIIAQKTKIPLAELLDDQAATINNLTNDLQTLFFGQDHILEEVVSSIKRAKLGLADENRPQASFIFFGPSGVGKTYLAKLLADKIFHDKEAFIRIDMSEFSEKINATKLVGAPAGYVGYREGNKLTDAVKKRPYSLVLFDEIEKAHPEVIHLLLQVLEDGYLTDATGKTINFRNTIIIMTSNIGHDQLTKKSAIGFGGTNDTALAYETVLKMAKTRLSPEFINRIDKHLFFKPLDENALAEVIRFELHKLQDRLKAKGITIDTSTKNIIKLAQKAAALDQGARGVRKIIFDNVERPLTEMLKKSSKQKSLNLM